jgi:hypothetical protein
MTALEAGAGGRGRRPSAALLASLIAAAAVLLLALANTHLVYVAFTTQPECVAHLKTSEAASDKGAFSAAKPAC